MRIYVVDYAEDVVEPIEVPDGRYFEEELEDMYGIFYYTYKEAKEDLDENML